MTFTYDADPSEDALDLIRIRDLIGDTDRNDPFLEDEPILRALADTGSVIAAAAVAAGLIKARLARKIPRATGTLKADYQVQWEHYRDLEKDLKAERNRAFALRAAPVFAHDHATPPGPIFTRHLGERLVDEARVRTDADLD